MGIIRRLLALVVLLCAISLVGTAAYTFYYQRPAELPQGAAIVVLSAGLSNGEMGSQTAERTATAVALYQELVARGETPIIVMSGGQGPDEPTAKATLMGDFAREAGVPITDLRIEAESQSTLQNALFTKSVLGEAAVGPLIVVTHRYHLPRASASFWWAGMKDVTLFSAEPEDATPIIEGLILESVKWPLNAARAAAYSGLVAAGMDKETLISFLR